MSKENMDDYNTFDKDYYGNRILPRGIQIEIKQVPADYDPTEFLPGGVPDVSGRVNLNAEHQRKRAELEKEIVEEMKETISSAK